MKIKKKKEEKNIKKNDEECVTICKAIYDKKEEKEEAEAVEYNAKRRDNYNGVIFVMLISLIFLTVGVVVYSVYVFIHVTHISDLAGVHVTQSLQNAADYVEGKTPGNANSLTTYKGDAFEFQYPGSLEFKNDNGVITLRKYNESSQANFNSLAMTITAGELADPSNLSIKDLLKQNNQPAPDSEKETILDGRSTLRTGKVQLPDGPIADTMYWKLDGKIVYCGATYYDQSTADLEAAFQGVISSFKF